MRKKNINFNQKILMGPGPTNIDDKIKKAQELRDQGMDAHKAGDHAKSEELLGKALDLFKS